MIRLAAAVLGLVAFLVPGALAALPIALPALPATPSPLVAMPAMSPEATPDAVAAATAFVRSLHGPTLAATSGAPHDPPDWRFRWAKSSDDLDGRGGRDLIVNELDLYAFTEKVIALSSSDRHELWSYDAGFALDQVSLTALEGRAGSPPGPHHNGELAPDLDGDGVADVVVRQADARWLLPENPVANTFVVTGAYHGLSGRDGHVLWTVPIAATFDYVETQAGQAVLTWTDMPSGWAVADAPGGPRFVHKTTTMAVTVASVAGALQFYVADVEGTETLHCADARHPETDLWTKTFASPEEPQYAVTTWITGLADVGGGNQPDVVLDSFLTRRPVVQDAYENPLTGDPLYREGKAMRVEALDGANGNALWTDTVYEQPPFRPNLPLEEPFEVLWNTYATLTPDADGDGRTDVVAQVFVQDSTSPGTVNGQFSTHFILLDGAKGTKHFDHAYRGWGFATSLAVPGRPSPGLLGIGTVDIPTGAAPQGTFPFKEIHLVALHVADGTPAWDASNKWGQDSNLVFDLSLYQFARSLAPADYDGDGVLDIVSPAEYVRPAGANQTLLATSQHHYEVLSGADGHRIRLLDAWGPYGAVVECGGEDGTLTVVTGHARRFDLTRFDVRGGSVLWRRPYVFDARQRPATAPVDLDWLAPMCDHRTEVETFSLNIGTQAIGRPNNGREFWGTIALLGPDGGVRWIDPKLPVDVPLLPSIAAAPPAPRPAWWSRPEALLIPAGVVPGAGLGVALRLGLARRGGGLP